MKKLCRDCPLREDKGTFDYLENEAFSGHRKVAIQAPPNKATCPHRKECHSLERRLARFESYRREELLDDPLGMEVLINANGAWGRSEEPSNQTLQKLTELNWKALSRKQLKLIELYYLERKTLRQIASTLKWQSDRVHYQLKKSLELLSK